MKVMRVLVNQREECADGIWEASTALNAVAVVRITAFMSSEHLRLDFRHAV
jgi:hypothetical protein